jgi:hypothetical protein
VSEADVAAKIAADLLVTDFAALRPHAARGALIVVAPTLRLVDVGVAVARNRSAVVALWLAEGLLRKPTPAELLAWEATPSEPRFRFVIVQPYVLTELLLD